MLDPGPGVGKTHLATALGHVGIRRRRSVLFTRADQLFRNLKAARLDNSIEAEMRRLTRVELLIIDDLALKAIDPTETADFYELAVKRRHKTATIVTSNRDASEWIGVMSDPLLAQSDVDRLVATSYELVIEGSPTDADNDPYPPPNAARQIDQKESTDEHHHAALVVPSSWQPGGFPIALASDTEEGLALAPSYPEDSVDAQESHSLGGEPRRKRSWFGSSRDDDVGEHDALGKLRGQWIVGRQACRRG